MIEKETGKVVGLLLETDARQATKYLAEKEVITATRRAYKGRISKRDNVEMVVKIGRPNFGEREFIKKCKKAGEPFPVKKIQLKFFKK